MQPVISKFIFLIYDIEYKTTITIITIIVQIERFLKKCFSFLLVAKKDGKIRIRTQAKKNAVKICSTTI
tara:strand:+ start:1323 stop:1529 length:207 start_codon:yes stop_codon:yes gene_type:complete